MARSYAKPAPSNAAVMAQLKTFLANCDDARLAALTVDGLLAMFRMERRLLECTLLASQDTRRRFVAKHLNQGEQM